MRSEPTTSGRFPVSYELEQYAADRLCLHCPSHRRRMKNGACVPARKVSRGRLRSGAQSDSRKARALALSFAFCSASTSSAFVIRERPRTSSRLAGSSRVGQVMSWPRPIRLPSLSWNQAARSPMPLSDGRRPRCRPSRSRSAGPAGRTPRTRRREPGRLGDWPRDDVYRFDARTTSD